MLGLERIDETGGKLEKSNSKSGDSGVIVVSHYSALCMLRLAHAHGAKIKYTRTSQFSARRSSAKEARKLIKIITQISPQHKKLEILLAERNKCNNSNLISCHVCTAKLPYRSFVKIEVDDDELQRLVFDRIVVASPMLVLCQMSGQVPAYRLLQWGMEACGNYVITPSKSNDPRRPRGFGFLHIEQPIATPLEIKSYFEKTRGVKIGQGRKKEMLCKWIAANSASPAETNLYILLCGPRKQGFYQLRNFKLNSTIRLSDEARTICGQQTIKPDLCNIRNKIAIEYDSKEFHTNELQNQKDKRRSTALAHDGWQVITIVPYQINNYQAFKNVAIDLLKRNGQDTRIKSSCFHKTSTTNFIKIWR